MKSKRLHILVNWSLVCGYCLMIVILSSASTPDLMPSIDYSDKVLHFVAFAVLSILFFRALRSTGFNTNVSILIFFTLLFSTLFGIFIELNQSFIPYRQAEAMDVGADVIGSIAGIIVYRIFFRERAESDSVV